MFKIITDRGIVWQGLSLEDASVALTGLLRERYSNSLELRCGANSWAHWYRAPHSWRRVVAPRGQENIAVYSIKES